MTQKRSLAPAVFLVLLVLLLSPHLMAVHADEAPTVWRAAFVSNNEAISLVHLPSGDYSVLFHSLDTGATKLLSAIDTKSLPFLVSGSTPQTVFVTDDKAVYSFNTESGKQDCFGLRGKESFGVVGQGRYVLSLSWTGMLAGSVAAFVEPAIPSKWLRDKLPRVQHAYSLNLLATGDETVRCFFPIHVSPLSPAHVGSGVVDLDEDTFAVVESVLDLEDVSASDSFQVRAFTFDTLKEVFTVQIPGFPRGLRVTRDGSLLVVAYTYEDETWRIWAIDPEAGAKTQPVPRLAASIKDERVHQAMLAHNCLILALESEIKLRELQSGQENSLDLGSTVSFAVSPDGTRLLTWHAYDPGLDMNLFDISKSRLDDKRTIRPNPAVLQDRTG